MPSRKAKAKEDALPGRPVIFRSESAPNTSRERSRKRAQTVSELERRRPRPENLTLDLSRGRGGASRSPLNPMPSVLASPPSFIHSYLGPVETTQYAAATQATYAVPIRAWSRNLGREGPAPPSSVPSTSAWAASPVSVSSWYPTSPREPSQSNWSGPMSAPATTGYFDFNVSDGTSHTHGNVSSDGYSTLSDNDNFSPNDVLSPLSTCSSTLSSPNFIYNQNRSPNSFSNCRGAEEQIFWPQQTFDPNEYLEVQYTPEQSSTQLSSHTTQALYHSISYDIPMAYNSTDFAFPHQH